MDVGRKKERKKNAARFAGGHAEIGTKQLSSNQAGHVTAEDIL